MKAKHPYNDCCVTDCGRKAEWLPVVLIYDPVLGKVSTPNQVYIKSSPLCPQHKSVGRFSLASLISASAWAEIAGQFERAGLRRPVREKTGVGFVRIDEVADPEAQFVDKTQLKKIKENL